MLATAGRCLFGLFGVLRPPRQILVVGPVDQPKEFAGDHREAGAVRLPAEDAVPCGVRFLGAVEVGMQAAHMQVEFAAASIRPPVRPVEVCQSRGPAHAIARRGCIAAHRPNQTPDTRCTLGRFACFSGLSGGVHLCHLFWLGRWEGSYIRVPKRKQCTR